MGPAGGFTVIELSVDFLLLFTLVSTFRKKLSAGKPKNLVTLYAEYWKRPALVVSEEQNQRLLNSSHKFLAWVLGAILQSVPAPV